MILSKRNFFILFFLISIFSILVPNYLYAQSTKTYTLYTTNVNNPWRWDLAGRARYAPNGMEAIQPFYDDNEYSSPLIATGFDSWILPAGEVITNVKIGAYVAFRRVYHNAYVNLGTNISGIETGWHNMAGALHWEVYDITHARPSWTKAQIDALDVNISKQKSNRPDSEFKVDAIRIVITTEVPSITVTSPQASANWNIESTQNITWTKTGTQNANVKLRLLQNGVKILGITDSTPNDGSYSWTIPASITPASNYVVRVKTIDNLVTDDSDLMTISLAPSITFGEIAGDFYPGSQIPINWTCYGNISGTLSLYLMNTITSEQFVIAENIPFDDNIYNYTVPNDIPPGNYIFRLVINNTAAFFDSDGNEIALCEPAEVHFYSPSGGILEKGSNVEIQFNIFLWNKVNVTLWQNGELKGTILQDFVGDTTPPNTILWRSVKYNWEVGKCLDGNTYSGTGFKIKVETTPDYTGPIGIGYPIPMAESEIPFEIKELTPTVNFTSNVSSVDIGGAVELSWTSTNATSISISNAVGPFTPIGGGQVTVNPTSNTTYEITAMGPGGEVKKTVIISINAPTVNLGATETTIINGNSTTLNWTSTNSTALSIDNGVGTVTPVVSGNVSVGPTVTTTYTITATGPSGTETATVTVTVNDPEPTVTLSSDLSTVNIGDPVVLSWTSTDTTSLTIDNGVGTVTPVDAGSVTVNPTSATTYTITATCPGGTKIATVTITVPLPTVTLTAGEITIIRGSSTTLNWTSTNATVLSIDNGVGAVTPVSAGSTTISPIVTTIYIITAIGPSGTETATVTVTVNEPVPTVTLISDVSTVNIGDPVLLSWTSTDATSLDIDNGVGAVTPITSGSTSVNPTVTTTYTITATGPGGTETASVTITVPVPTVTLTATETTIINGNSTTLNWTSLNATSLLIDNGVGTVTPVASGNVEISPTVTTTYTITATGPSGTETASVTVTVNEPEPTVTLSSDLSTVNIGEPVVLSWTSTDATSLTIDNGVGAVSPVSAGSTTVNPTATTTYTITATGPGGTKTATIIITVPLPTVTLIATDPILIRGNSTTLNWTSLNGTSLSIDNGIGAVTPVVSGSVTISPTATTTYIIIATGPSGTETATVTVTVNDPPLIITVTSPGIFTDWERNTQKMINWTKSPELTTNVKIDLMDVSKTNIIATIVDSSGTANDGEFEWSIPTIIDPANYYIRVSTIDDIVINYSEQFAISKGTISVTTPNNTTDWVKNSFQNIEWTTSAGITSNLSINITLFKDGDASPIAITSGTENIGSFDWEVPIGLVSGNYYVQIKTVDLEYDALGNSSVFTVLGGSINISSPPSGAQYFAGTTMPITWAPDEITGNVSIELRKVDESSFVVINPQIAYNTGTLEYLIPSELSPGDYYIKVYQGLIIGKSNPFTINQAILPTVTLSANPAIIYSPETSTTLTWDSENYDDLLISNNINSDIVDVISLAELVVNPTVTTTYTITASKVGAASATSQVTVYMGVSRNCNLYITNLNDNKLKVFNADTFAEIDSIDLNPSSSNLEPLGVSIDKYGDRLFVTGVNDTQLLEIDAENYSVRKHSLSSFSKYSAIHPNGKYMYASSTKGWSPTNGRYDRILYVFGPYEVGNPTSLMMQSCSFYVGEDPGDIMVHPNGLKLYVSNPSDNTIFVLDVEKLNKDWTSSTSELSDQLIKTILISSNIDIEGSATGSIRGRTHNIDLSVDGSKLFVSHLDKITIIDTLTDEIERTIDLTGAKILKVNPSGDKLYVISSGQISIITLEGEYPSTTIPINTDYVYNMGFHPDGSKLFLVTSRYSSSGGGIRVFDTSTNSVITTINTGNNPYAYGNFIGYISHKVSGNVKTNGIVSSGAIVEFEKNGEYKSVKTNADGDYSIKLHNGLYNVTISKCGVDSFGSELFQVAVPGPVTGKNFDIIPKKPEIINFSTDYSNFHGWGLFFQYSGAENITLNDGTSTFYDVNVPDCYSYDNYSLSVDKTTIYTFTATNQVGSTSKTVSIIKNGTPPAVILKTDSNPINIGESITLSWMTADATTVTIDNNVGTFDPNITTSIILAPQTTTTYEITATGPGGTKTATVEVIVNVPLPTVSLTANPDTITVGDPASLSWATTYTESVEVDNGVGTFDPLVTTSVMVNPLATTTYTITATGPNGHTETATATITVLIPPAPTASISISPDATNAGDPATLTWSTTDASSVVISHLGPVGLSGSVTVNPIEDTEYIITAIGPIESRTAVTNITVTNTNPKPEIYVEAFPKSIMPGQSTTLYWSATNADSVTIDGFPETLPVSGQKLVTPGGETSYTFTASGPGGTASSTINITSSLLSIAITSPSNEAEIHKPFVLVEGTYINATGKEISVLVNGVPALLIDDTHFAAYHVPVQAGANIIRAVVTDVEGNQAGTEVTVTGLLDEDYIKLEADSNMGPSPMTVTLRLEGSISISAIGLSSISSPGGSIEAVPGSEEYVFKYTLTGPGIYYFTATVTENGKTYTDVEAIKVVDGADLDTMFKAKWNGMKTALLQNDIEAAVSYFTLKTSSDYRDMFTAISDQLTSFVGDMQEIESVIFTQDGAKYRIRKEQIIEGETHTITYYIYFVIDYDGVWKIWRF